MLFRPSNGCHTARRFGSMVCVLVALAQLACAAANRRYPLQEPMWRDPDQRPFAPPPEEYVSPFAWDGINQTIFRPISRFFAVDPGGESTNVNALDEVPDSSWFQNRLGRRGMSPEEVAQGACSEPPLDPTGPFFVVGGKPNGANPGFIVQTEDKQRYLFKFDSLQQPERATSADVVGSRIYHAAGFHVPCNRIIFFHPKSVRIGEGARVENAKGEKVPLAQHHIDAALKMGGRLKDGRVRASTSRFLPGRPIGPWKYNDVRSDDRNDVVPHEDRRELRGAYVLAAWINHFDSREQNTLAMWIAGPDKRGFVRHHIIDFGDSFGSLWDWDGISRRLGNAYYLDFGFLVEDFLTLGLVRRPWDRRKYGPAGRVLGYFDIVHFDADDWRPGYPNPAFSRLTERDAAWMARILALLSDAHIDAMLGEAHIHTPNLQEHLRHVLIGRRDKLLERWLSRLSALSQPEVVVRGDAAHLCVRDRFVQAKLVAPGKRAYRAQLAYPVAAAMAATVDGAGACVSLHGSWNKGTKQQPVYLVVEINSRHNPPPLRVHLYHLGGAQFRVAGLERRQ